MKKETKQAPKQEEQAVKPMRRIIIETDGDGIKIVSAEVSGNIELVAVLQAVIGALSNRK